jgi:predicted TIM-barrel fold metal-dependent hydrolase
VRRRSFLQAVGAASLAPFAGAFGATPAGAEPGGKGGNVVPFSIVDTHVHFWDPSHLRYPWTEKSKLLNRAYLPSDYTAAVAPVEVERIVFVQAACLPSQAMQEVEWVTGLAKEDPRIQGIVADAPLEQGEGVVPALEKLAANPLVKGVRRMLAGEKDPEFALRHGFVDGVRALGHLGLECEFGIHRGQILMGAELAKRCPHIRFILCHCGVPDIRKQEFDPWRDHIRQLAALPNVFCKMSGLATAADLKAWKPADLKPAIDHVIDCFSVQRVAFGSDWPVMLAATQFPRWVETVAWATEGCTRTEQERLFRGTAIEYYGLEGKTT